MPLDPDHVAPAPSRQVLEELILQLAQARGADKSICPSEAARHFGHNWQRHMTAVRQAAFALARDGKIQVLRKGKPVENLDEVRGVIRLRCVANEK